MNESLILENPDLLGFWKAFKSNEGFNQASFRQLVEDTGEDTTLKILARFSETLKEVEGHVVEGLDKENSELIWKACHKIAGSAELVGFASFGSFARDLSHQIRANPDLSNYDSDLNAFLKKARDIQAHLKSNVLNLSEHL